jgi:UDPglucose 6-dehydrogenase
MAVIKSIYRLGMIDSVPFVMTNSKTAEMIKYSSNVFLAMKIGYINEISRLCGSLEVDVLEVARAMGYDKRIGAEFLNPGPGWGGSCLPKDLREFLGLATSNDIQMGILNSVQLSNQHQHEFVIQIIEKLSGPVSGKKIAALGLTFKANTSDLRESPALKIVEMLRKDGAEVALFDPVADPNDPLLPEDAFLAISAYQAAENADCLLILTEWPEFQMLDWKKIAKLVRQRNIVDTRNLLFPDTMKAFGFNYASMGQL